MKSWLKENWFKVAIVLLLCLMSYWYGIRARNIRLNCYDRIIAPEQYDKRGANTYDGPERTDNYKDYQDCLIKSGL